MATQQTAVAAPLRPMSESAQLMIDTDRAIQYTAKLMVASGCFADVKSATEEQAIAKAFVKIGLGRDMGFSATESMQYVELIQGKPSIAAHGRAAKMKAAGYSWKFKQFDEKACVLDVYSPSGELIGESGFTMDDAKRMGLAGKDNWTKNPRNMLYCRAVSNAQRWYAPEVLSAALPSREELLDGELSVIGQGEMAVATDARAADLKARLAAQKDPEIVDAETVEPEPAEPQESMFGPLPAQDPDDQKKRK